MILVNGKELEKKQFTDGTYLLYCFNSDKEVEISWFYESDEELFQIICLAKYLKEQSKERVSLNVPYLPNGRMDRVEREGEIFTLKYFCQIINSLEFDSVEVLDIHSKKTRDFLDRMVNHTPKKYIERALERLEIEGGETILYFPDQGASKRYRNLFSNRPYCYGKKKRIWKSGEISSLEVVGRGESIEGKVILMIDDICSSGETFYYSALELEKLGAKEIYSFASHTENTILEEENKYYKMLEKGKVKKHFTTRSLLTGKSDLIEVLP